MKTIRANTFSKRNLVVIPKSFTTREGTLVNYQSYEVKEKGSNTLEITSGKVITYSKISAHSKELSMDYAITATNLINTMYNRRLNEEVKKALLIAEAEIQKIIDKATAHGTKVHELAQDGRYDCAIEELAPLRDLGGLRVYREKEGQLLVSWNIPLLTDPLILSYMPDAIVEFNKHYVDNKIPYDVLNSKWYIIDYKATNSDYSYRGSRQLNIGAVALARSIVEDGDLEAQAKVYNNISLYLVTITKENTKQLVAREENPNLPPFQEQVTASRITKLPYKSNVKMILGTKATQEWEIEMNKIYPEIVWGK